MSSLKLPPPRGRRNQPGGPASTSDSAAASKDAIVQQTDQDASQSRLCAVQAGYLDDPFAAAFVAAKGQRRFPLINRGTYVRTTAIDALVTSFLAWAPGRKKQVVSLGAGSDTRFFRLRQRQQRGLSETVYHEVDFAAVTRGKIAAIERDEPRRLRALVGDAAALDRAGGSLASPLYHVHPLDLRALRPGCALPPAIDPAVPTLFLSECCLVYLAPAEADAILQWATSAFAAAVGIVLYEPIGGDDAFGRVMVQNLAARGIVLKTLARYSTLARQKERLRVLGFRTGQQAADVDFIHDRWIPEDERERIAGLEMLDEVEEWQLLARHYCVAYGWRDGEGSGEEGQGFAGWDGAFPVQNAEN